MKREIIAALLIGCVCAAPALAASDVVKTDKPKVDVVFVLDTTGSMGGLIQAAKEKIWAVANTFAQSKPAPEIRMGLIGYRDRGDAYVTKITDLNSNLDSVYEQLMSYSADGGGDTPESVNQALDEAVSKISWNSDPQTYRAIFLVGDAPPHMDYQQETKYAASVGTANKKGIVVNAIQCGDIAETTPIFSDIALKGEGKFFKLAQSGNAVLAASPYDAELAELSGKLDDTRMTYGSRREQDAQKSKFLAGTKLVNAAPASAVAQRSAINSADAGKENFLGSKELVNDIGEGRVDLDKLSKEELPDELKNVPAEKRAEIVKEKLAERKEIQAKIRSLSEQRQGYLEKEAKKKPGGKTLDDSLYEAIKDQAGAKGMTISGGPRY